MGSTVKFICGLSESLLKKTPEARKAIFEGKKAINSAKLAQGKIAGVQTPTPQAEAMVTTLNQSENNLATRGDFFEKLEKEVAGNKCPDKRYMQTDEFWQDPHNAQAGEIIKASETWLDDIYKYMQNICANLNKKAPTTTPAIQDTIAETTQQVSRNAAGRTSHKIKINGRTLIPVSEYDGPFLQLTKEDIKEISILKNMNRKREREISKLIKEHTNTTTGEIPNVINEQITRLRNEITENLQKIRTIKKESFEAGNTRIVDKVLQDSSLPQVELNKEQIKTIGIMKTLTAKNEKLIDELKWKLKDSLSGISPSEIYEDIARLEKEINSYRRRIAITLDEARGNKAKTLVNSYS